MAEEGTVGVLPFRLEEVVGIQEEGVTSPSLIPENERSIKMCSVGGREGGKLPFFPLFAGRKG